MSSQTQTPKEKYESLIKELRLQKSLPILEKIFEDLKNNKEHLYNNEIIPYKFSNDFIWFLKTNLIDKNKFKWIYLNYISSNF